jgi:hypothetical protein
MSSANNLLSGKTFNVAMVPSMTAFVPTLTLEGVSTAQSDE